MNLNGGLFGKVAPGMCRLSMNGQIAVKTTGGYKTYDITTGRLTNCDNFVFDIGEDLFFAVPTSKVKVGDIILVGGKPKCVIEVGKNSMTVINYEDSRIDTIVPERHMFMGNMYITTKIMSAFGKSFTSGKKDGMESVMKYVLMSEMMKGGSGANNMLPLLMMSNGGFGGMFDGMFDFDELDEEDGEEE